MIRKRFVGFPVKLWITLWETSRKSRQVLDSRPLRLDCLFYGHRADFNQINDLAWMPGSGHVAMQQFVTRTRTT
jgi:hypothetical protein